MQASVHHSLSAIPVKSWMGWFLLTCFCVFQFTLQGSIGIFADGMKESLGLEAQSLSLLSSSFYYSYILMQIPVGFIFDRYKIRWITTGALILVCTSLVMFAYAQTLFMAVIARILMGLACSFGFLGLVVATAKWFPPRYFALLVAGTESIGMLGVAGMNSLISHLVVEFNWRFASWVCALIALTLALALFVLCPCEKNHQAEKKEKSLPLLESLRCVSSYKELWYGGLFSFATFASITVFAGLWAIPFVMASTQVDLVSATSLVSILLIGSAVSSPLVGWLCGFVKYTYLMIPGALINAFLMLWLILVAQTSTTSLSVLLFSIGFMSAVYQIPFALVNDVVPEHSKGVAMGLTNIICMVNSPILQPIIAGLLTLNHDVSSHGFESYPLQNFQHALLVLPLCLFIAVYLAWKLREPSKTSLTI